MPTWIALLRGINVGGKNILPMRRLIQDLEALGARECQTYIQSGNVVFRAARGTASSWSKKIAAKIDEQHGFRLFLASKPSGPDVAALNRVRTSAEEFELKDSVFYLHAPDGIGKSKLANRAENYLGVEGTGRNWRTVLKLSEMAEKAP